MSRPLARLTGIDIVPPVIPDAANKGSTAVSSKRKSSRKCKYAWRIEPGTIPFMKRGMVALVALAFATGAAAAQSVSVPYAGKQIRMVIAAGPGGGYDTYARYLARHLAKHIAGSPTIISQNMPGAAGMA